MLPVWLLGLMLIIGSILESLVYGVFLWQSKLLLASLILWLCRRLYRTSHRSR